MADVPEYVDLPVEEAALILRLMIEEAEPRAAVFKFSTRTFMFIEYDSSRRLWSVVVGKLLGPHSHQREVARFPLTVVPETVMGFGRCYVDRTGVVFMVGEVGFEIKVEIHSARTVIFTRLR